MAANGPAPMVKQRFAGMARFYGGARAFVGTAHGREQSPHPAAAVPYAPSGSSR